MAVFAAIPLKLYMTACGFYCPSIVLLEIFFGDSPWCIPTNEFNNY
jgi:hypothetical protein